jgi:hypothetical protein
LRHASAPPPEEAARAAKQLEKNKANSEASRRRNGLKNIRKALTLHECTLEEVTEMWREVNIEKIHTQ